MMLASFKSIDFFHSKEAWSNRGGISENKYATIMQQ
ncbi:hypothetical protein IGL76_000606 [Enterococcus sp. DIV2381]|uniref:Uncharacterized protein n=1 Tax=Candidatus Enterococcus mangumiae TaxID=2230878 RepID=A0ABZ2SWV9_9ENTE